MFFDDHRFAATIVVDHETANRERQRCFCACIFSNRSDRKFVAVANAHPDKPPIMHATDSKWWAWKDALKDVGITVHFLCPDYVKAKCTPKKIK